MPSETDDSDGMNISNTRQRRFSLTVLVRHSAAYFSCSNKAASAARRKVSIAPKAGLQMAHPANRADGAFYGRAQGGGQAGGMLPPDGGSLIEQAVFLQPHGEDCR